MDNLFFYPTFNDNLREISGCSIFNYDFSYYFADRYHKLTAKGKNIIKLDEPMGTWKIENDGLMIKKRIVFENTGELYGPGGIACKGAKISACIIWTNKRLTQMGTILPTSEAYNGEEWHIRFEHEFKAGEIQGDLGLETILYIKESAEDVEEAETSLMNEEGVNIGTLDYCSLAFDSESMDFPIQEINIPDQPLWWIEFGEWMDPREDLFNEENICLFLNNAYEGCPRIGETIKNMDMLIEIIASAYTMVFLKIEEMGLLQDTINDVNLEPGSICKAMEYFCSSGGGEFDYGSPERMHKSIWMIIKDMFTEG